MTSNNLIAKTETSIHGTTGKVWDALVNPDMISKYMFGTKVDSDWAEGSEIVWKGGWKGKPYEDKGKILQIIPDKLLQYSHFSPLTGQEDQPENYHTITIKLKKSDDQTLVTLSQDKNATEKEKEDAEKNWQMMLKGLKELLEKK